jgi:hypothetical protein
VADGVDGVGLEELLHPWEVANGCLLEDVAIGKGPGDILEAFRIAGVGEAVGVDDSSGEVGFLEQMPDEVGSDEAAAAGDQEGRAIGELRSQIGVAHDSEWQLVNLQRVMAVS